MLLNDQTMQLLISDYSRQVVHEVASEEDELFDELVKEYFQDPNPPAQLSEAGDDPLGSGLSELLIAATPAAVAMVSTVLTYLLTEIIKTTHEDTVETLKQKLKQLFQPDRTPLPLTKEQLEYVRNSALKQGYTFGLESAEAQKMADALVGILVVGSLEISGDSLKYRGKVSSLSSSEKSMPREDISRFIVSHQSRLQKLKELQALYGLDTSPHILIEIEDITAIIEDLQITLE